MKDLKIVFKKTILDTITSLKREGKYFIPIFLLIMFLEIVADDILYRISYKIPQIIASILPTVINIIKYSLLAKILNSLITTDKLHLKNIGTNFGYYVINVISALFVVFIIRYFLMIAAGPILDKEKLIVVSTMHFIIIYIILSPMLEIVYLDGKYGIDLLKSCFHFWKENLMPWLFMNMFFYVLIYLKKFVVQIEDISFQNILYLTVIALYLIMRGKAYQFLSTTNKRKREFMNEYKDFD